MMRNDWIPEQEFFKIVNDLAQSSGCKPFSFEEMDPFVTRLKKEDKMMLSDGYFYPIWRDSQFYEYLPAAAWLAG